jgi:RNA polymerase sigma-70 factor (ECF subfamily)
MNNIPSNKQSPAGAPNATETDADGPLDWAAILEQHRSWLRTVIAARCKEPQAVDEILQELSMAVLKQRAPLKDKQKVAPWLYQIAVRQSLMYRRKHGRRRNMEQRYADQLRSSAVQKHTPDPLSWLLANERRQLIRQGVEQLSPKEAEILMLKYTQDWSYKQIAEHLGTTESAVESRLHRARKNLRQRMVALEVIESK